LLACLVIAFAANPATASGAVVRDGYGSLDLTWTTRPDRTGQGRVRFREEAKDADYQRKINGRSLEGAAGIDCASRRFQLDRFAVYRLAGLRGERVLEIGERPEWRAPEPDTTMGRVVLAACGPEAASRRAVQTPGIAETRRAFPSEPRPEPISEITVTQPHDRVASISEVLDAAGGTRQRPSIEPAAKVAPVIAAGVGQGAFQVQLAALSSPERADEAWRKMAAEKASLLGRLPERVTSVTVKGVIYYRLLVGRFPTLTAAQALCKALGVSRAGCIVRPDPGERASGQRQD
jgi:hypothetical protein